MKKIDFTKIKIFGSFEDEAAGKTQEINIARDFANRMKYSGPVLMDIGFEDLASTIYHSTGPVEIPDEYIQALRECILSSPYYAAVKRSLLQSLAK